MLSPGWKNGAVTAAAALLLGLALLVPGAAVARGGRTFTWPGGGPTFEFGLRTGGYKLGLQSQPGVSVGLTVTRGGSTKAENLYVVKGEVSKEGDITGDLGKYGKVALSFEPKGRPKREKFPFPGCRGKPTLIQHGVFVGRLRFRGEGGFIKVRRSRIRGTSTTSFPQVCREKGGGSTGPSEEKGRERLEEAELTASIPNERLEFNALGAHEKGGGNAASVFLAGEVRLQNGVFEIRNVVARGHARAFEFDEALDSATIRPGGPFEGSATFERGAGGAGTWTGDLRADFLGGSERLTGGRIEATLERPKDSSESSGVFGRPFLANLTRSPVPIDR